MSNEDAWHWVWQRFHGLDPRGIGDVSGDSGAAGILGQLPSDVTATSNQGGSLPDSGGVNLGQARFDDPHPVRSPYAWSDDNGATVYIQRPDHSLEIRQGGTLAWRNNNPGNMAMSKSAEIGHNDSVGKDGKPRRFAIFGDLESGKASQNRLLLGPDYSNLSISDAIKKYAPNNENDTEAYIADVARRTGLDRSTILSTLSEQQRMAYVNAIRAHEGSKPGTSSMTIYNPWGD